MTEPSWSIAVHGGAGSMTPATMPAAAQSEHLAALEAARDAGTVILRAGGSALDAVCASVAALEDDPRFNAGRGAVFTYHGTTELDAAVMDGAARAAGAVAA